MTPGGSARSATRAAEAKGVEHPANPTQRVGNSLVVGHPELEPGRTHGLEIAARFSSVLTSTMSGWSATTSARRGGSWCRRPGRAQAGGMGAPVGHADQQLRRGGADASVSEGTRLTTRRTRGEGLIVVPVRVVVPRFVALATFSSARDASSCVSYGPSRSGGLHPSGPSTALCFRHQPPLVMWSAPSLCLCAHPGSAIRGGTLILHQRRIRCTVREKLHSTCAPENRRNSDRRRDLRATPVPAWIVRPEYVGKPRPRPHTGGDVQTPEIDREDARGQPNRRAGAAGRRGGHRPRRHHRRGRPSRARVPLRPWRVPVDPRLQGLPEVTLYVCQRGHLPRDPGLAAPGGRRHLQHRHHRVHRWRAR